MKGNFQVRFLGDWAVVRPPGYPATRKLEVILPVEGFAQHRAAVR
jgi:hypothetical protein